MIFKNPARITCESCGSESLIPVKSLLELNASCPNCHASFKKIGESMRHEQDEWTLVCILVDIYVIFERRFGFSIDGTDFVANTKTVGDIVARLEEAGVSRDQTTAALIEYFGVDFTQLAKNYLDMPVLVADDPRRREDYLKTNGGPPRK